MQSGDKSPLEARVRQKDSESGRSLFVEGCQGRPLWRGDVCTETSRTQGSLTTTGKPGISIFSKLSINIPQTKPLSSLLSTNICLWPVAEKFYTNHIFKQTHDHKLIQYAHEMIIYFMGLLHRKKAFFSMFILYYKSLLLHLSKKTSFLSLMTEKLQYHQNKVERFRNDMAS